MKRLFSLLVASFVLMLPACVQPEQPGEITPGTLDAPSLQANPSSVSITDYSDVTCLTYSWNDVAPEGVSPTYSLQLAKAEDTSFSNAVTVTCPGAGKQFSSYLMAEIASELGADIKTGFDLIARVNVSADKYEPAVSNVVSVHVGQVRYEVSKLFITGVGEAPVEMTLEDGVFTWQGHLEKGAEFKFPCQDNAPWPSVARDPVADGYWSARLCFSEVDDFGFAVSVPGIYKLFVDARDSNAPVVTAQLIEPDLDINVTELYIIGDAVGNADDLSKMEAFAGSDGVFTWKGHLDPLKGFRFPIQSSASWPALMITTDGKDLVYVEDEAGQESFVVTDPGIYEITVDAKNVNALSYTIELIEKDKVIRHLYPVGGFDWGWNKDVAEEMTTEDGVIYYWKGTIWANADFKFLCQRDAWSPGYTRNAEADDYWTLVYNDGSLPDTQFQVSETGVYVVTLNLETLKISVRKASDSPDIFLIGAAFNWGWDKDAAEQMTTEDGITYTWSGFMWGSGDFKFLCQRDAWAPGYNRDGNASDYWTLIYNDGSAPDVQFQVPENGEYTVTINIETLKIKVAKKEEPPTPSYQDIFLIGAAFDWGWNQSAAEQMTTTDGITYTWTGNMWGERDFKFLCQRDAWAPGYNRDANASDYWTLVYRASDSDPDVQFQVPENGEHTITINIQTMKVTVQGPPKPDYPKIYPVGCINDWGWDLGKIQPMDTEDGITYTITVKIWADNDFKFLCQNDGWFPDYVRDKNASDYFTVIKRESADSGIEDAAFRLDTQGMESANYKITLNVQTRKLTLEKQ